MSVALLAHTDPADLGLPLLAAKSLVRMAAEVRGWFGVWFGALDFFFCRRRKNGRRPRHNCGHCFGVQDWSITCECWRRED